MGEATGHTNRSHPAAAAFLYHLYSYRLAWAVSMCDGAASVDVPSSCRRDEGFATFSGRQAIDFAAETSDCLECRYQQKLGHGEEGSGQHDSCHHAESEVVGSADGMYSSICRPCLHVSSLPDSVLRVGKGVSAPLTACDTFWRDKPSISSIPVPLAVSVHCRNEDCLL